MKKISKWITAILLVVSMVLSCMLTGVKWSAYAADTEPAPIQDEYQIDGVTYLKVNSNAFDTSPTQYILDMMRVGMERLKITNSEDNFNTYYSCIADQWLYLGAGLLRASDTSSTLYTQFSNVLEHAVARGTYSKSFGTVLNAQGSRIMNPTSHGDYDKSIMNYTSLADAEKALYSEVFSNASLQSEKGQFKNDSRDQTVLAGGAYSEYQGMEGTRIGMAVYFSDFKVVPLLPEDSGTNYIQSKTKNVTDESNIVASNVKNLTASNVSASQSVSKSQSNTVSSSISGSKSYSYSKSLEVSAEKDFKLVGFKIGAKASVSASKSISSGWSKSESESASESSSQSVSVTLDPYTNVMLKQSSTTEEWVTRYNCPVALQYTATVVLYKGDGSVIKSYQFGNDAREDIYNRAVVNGKLNDKEGIDWQYINTYSPVAKKAIVNASTFVPMSSTGGSFTETVNTVETEVENILPIYPLYKVKIRAPGVTYISDETYSYSSYNYLHTDMYVGDFSYINYMALDAFNKFNVEFYGFSKDFGHWVVADKDGNEWTGDDAPVVLEKDPVSKNTAYTAVKPGVCYIKFVIDEDVYTTADHPDVYTKNSDLYQTAAVRIHVLEKPFDGTVSISGKFKGVVNDQPRQLDAEGKLSVDICDKSGKEIVKPYVWEQKELPKKGMTLDGNLVSFTKAGTFHVRAVSGDIKSDWFAIKVTDPSAEPEKPAEKKDNTLNIKAKTASIKYSAVKKKAQTLAVSKIITFTNKG